LAQVRRRSGLTQRDLAGRMRVPRNTVWRWERAKMTPTTARFLAWILHLGAGIALLDQDGRVHRLAMHGAHPSHSLHTHLADMLLTERRRRGLTQAEIGAPIGATTHTMRRWEHERRVPTLENLCAWCRELGFKIVIVLPADHPALPRAPQSAAGLCWPRDHAAPRHRIHTVTTPAHTGDHRCTPCAPTPEHTGKPRRTAENI
jgi:transcriptional regulator with XRE-family HTH domain